MNTKGGTVGGGEILKYFSGNTSSGESNLNEFLILLYKSVPWLVVLICILLVSIAALLILRMHNIKSLKRGKGIEYEINNVKDLQSRDNYIIKSNKILSRLTKLVQSTPFKVSTTNREYINYNVKRAGLKVPGGFRELNAEEFNAIVKIVTFILIVIFLIIGMLINTFIGFVGVIATIICSVTLPMSFVRKTVSEKDDEIKQNFTDFYLMLHYVLLLGGKSPLDRIMLSYARTTDSKEMKRFVDICTSHIDTYGELKATSHISEDFREIPQVGKLMRIIKQLHEGGDVREELLGFREELIGEKRYEIEKRMNKLVVRAQASFYLLMIVLVQAIISAMSIYFPDLGIMGTLFGV